mmetsp:Transcript_19485/g.54298  ORF Transcript_19485/g.54298 Transcript_19485/m.54298 type:complete len:311 (-) Transcript_19485:2024-2956(-)
MPRSLPHGPYSLLVVLTATLGWFASLWEGDGCNYALVMGPFVDQLVPSYTSHNPVTMLQLGFDSYREIPPTQYNSHSSPSSDTTENSNAPSIATNITMDDLLPDWASKNSTAGCIDYPEAVTLGIMDSSWNTSRVFAFLGLVLGGGGASFLMCSLCFVFSRVTWKWTAYELLLAGFCQTISLVTWFQTQLCSWNNCGLSKGSISDMVSVGLWTLAGVLMVLNYPSCNRLGCNDLRVHNGFKKDAVGDEEMGMEGDKYHHQGSGPSAGEGVHDFTEQQYPKNSLQRGSYDEIDIEDDRNHGDLRYPQAEMA